jgi:DNA-binding protein HU-beta
VNAQELINAVAKEAGLSKIAARKAVNAFTDTVQASVKKGHKVVLAGFGTFERTTRKARSGRNPKTGESIKIPSSKRPKFRPGKSIKDIVNPR